MATAIISALTSTPVQKAVAMTGEITLRGRVLAIGGLKEKLLAAVRAGITTVILPRENGKDLEDLPQEVKKALTIHLVDEMEEVLRLALVKKSVPGKSKKSSKSLKVSAGHSISPTPLPS
jgi:ATP-dependent Lon protease